MGKNLDERGAQGFGFATDGTRELLVGGTNGEGALGMDEVHDGLCLSEVHFAVQEGALCELAGFGMAGARFEEGFKHTLSDKKAAMALELDSVLSGVAGWIAEQNGDALINSQLVLVASFD